MRRFQSRSKIALLLAVAVFVAPMAFGLGGPDMGEGELADVLDDGHSVVWRMVAPHSAVWLTVSGSPHHAAQHAPAQNGSQFGTFDRKSEYERSIGDRNGDQRADGPAHEYRNPGEFRIHAFLDSNFSKIWLVIALCHRIFGPIGDMEGRKRTSLFY